MSMPEFPTITPPLSREDAINQIISSIAMEELGISHIINAEGEKLQYVLGTIPGVSGPSATIEDVLKLNESVRAVLQHATESQTLLRSKLQQALTSGVLTGPTGPMGPAGPITTANTMNCFAVAQLSHILSQMITAYPTTTWTVTTQSVTNYLGVPLDIYTSPNATGPGFLRLVNANGNTEAITIAKITAATPGIGTEYDPNFTFLPPPDPLPLGCDADNIAAIQSYLSLGTDVYMSFGASGNVAGSVYRNEYGILVLSNEQGEIPIFVATPHILRIILT